MSGFFLQGHHGIGKSTLLHSELKLSKLQQCGYYVQRLLDDAANTCGFVVHPLPAHDVLLTAKTDQGNQQEPFIICHGSNVTMDRDKFVSVAANAVEDGLEKAQVVVLDEVGGIEILDDDFYALICRILTICTVVGVLKSDDNYNMLKRSSGLSGNVLEQRRSHIYELFASCDIEVFTLNDTNREAAQLGLRAFLRGDRWS